MAISTADFKNGLTIEYDGQLYQIVEFQHVKPGKGGAFVRTKLRNLITGATLENTFRAGEKMEHARIERTELEYLYRDGDAFVFMDMESYEQEQLDAAQVGSVAQWMKENCRVIVLRHRDTLIGVEVPQTMELTITETDPGLRGDTASGGSKPATLETGATVQVPLFLNIGDIIRVDTRTGTYLERVSQS